MRCVMSLALVAALPVPVAAQAVFTDATGETPLARVEAAIAAESGRLGAAKTLTPTRTTGGRLAITMAAVSFARDPASFHLFVATGPAPGVCHRTIAKAGFGRPALEAALAECLRGFTARAKAPGSAAAGTGSTPVPAATTALAQPRYPGNWSKVSAVLFQATQMIGVGGIPYPDFEPVILFADGRYMEVQDAALEDIDLAADAAAHPRRWGRWKTAPGGYTLIRHNGHAETMKLQGGSLFKAYGADAGKLDRDYRRISGGGNSGMGGDMTIAASSRYYFTADGRFSRTGSFGAIGSGATSGVSTAVGSRSGSGGVGAYTLSRHTLVLRHPDGRQRRHFFAYGSKGSPARPDREMIFIDGSVYTHME